MNGRDKDMLEMLLDNELRAGTFDTTNLDIISDFVEDSLSGIMQKKVNKDELNTYIKEYLGLHSIVCETEEEIILRKAW